MQPKLIKTRMAEYVPAQYCGRNESGYHPIGEKVLVLTDQCADTSSGGVDLPPEVVERMTSAAEMGVIVELGASAFNWMADRSHRWEGPKPNVGQRVFIERYSGQLCLGKDGQVYRILDDKNIGATMEAPSPIVPVRAALVS
jgi:co-chaperonin GroES (HSP10)